jgi:ABC-type lipoprotein release transport system permease subunit
MITCFTVAFGVVLSVSFTSIGDYAYTNLINRSSTMGFGHITVEPKGYNDTPGLDKRFSDAEKIVSLVDNIPGVKSALVRIVGQAMFATAIKNIGGTFIAIDPSKESAKWNLFVDSIVQGSLFEGTNGLGVVVGVKMAEKLKLRPGKKLIYTLTDVNGEIVSEISRVTGIFKTSVDEVDGSMVLLPIDRVRATLGYKKDEATIIPVYIEDQRDSDSMRNKINKLIENRALEVLTWDETQPATAGFINMDRGMNYLIQLLLGLLIAAGILNTLLMSVLERTREFGVMMAVGMSPGRLFRLVITESIWLGLLGLVLGVIITIPLYIYMTNVGIDFSSLYEEGSDAGGVLFDLVIKFRFYWESAVAILFAVFTLTVAAGLYPAFKSGRVAPVESLKQL